MGEPYGMWLPINLGEGTAIIDQLINWIHVFMVVLFVGWGIFYIQWIVRFRKSVHPQAIYEPVKGQFSKAVEVAVVIIEAILLIGLSMPAWARLRTEPPSAPDLTVRVVAQQFAWNVHYPGPDGKFGPTSPELIDEATNPVGLDRDHADAQDDVVEINNLYVPVGKEVLIRLTTKDVIHSFTVPVLRLKQDALPGMEVPVWFKAAETGTYEIACAQLCGISHFRMRGMIHIQSDEEFQTYLEGAGEEEFFEEEE